MSNQEADARLVIENIQHDFAIQDDGKENVAFKRISRNFKNSIKQLSNENKS